MIRIALDACWLTIDFLRLFIANEFGCQISGGQVRSKSASRDVARCTCWWIKMCGAEMDVDLLQCGGIGRTASHVDDPVGLALPLPIGSNNHVNNTLSLLIPAPR